MKEFYKKHKNNFIITFIAVCIVHFVKMTHYLPNWDNMYSMVMPDTSMVGFGRWLAGLISNMLTSQYDLQWVAGFLSAIFLGFTMCLLLDLFDVKSRFLSVVSILIMATFPSIAGAFMYIEWTAVYMLSLLMSVSAVYLIVKFKSKWRYVVCPILICLSLGIYQIYFLFALVCAVFYLATQLINSDKSLKDYLEFIRFVVYSIVVGFVLYYIINKVVLMCLETTLSNYQGIGKVGYLGIGGYLKAITKTLKSTITFFVDFSNISFYSIINIVILVSLILLVILTLVKSKQKLWIKILVAFLFLSIMPVTFLYYFLAKEVSYHTIMTIGLFFVYFEFIVLIDRKHIDIHKHFNSIVSFVLLLLCFYNFVNVNIAYKRLEMSYERTYFEVCEVVQFIDLVNEDGANEIFIVGSFARGNINEIVEPVPSIVGSSTGNFLHEEYHFIQFTKFYLGRDFISCSDEKRTNILESEEYKEIKTYPSKDCVKIIDGVIVVKMS